MSRNPELGLRVKAEVDAELRQGFLEACETAERTGATVVVVGFYNTKVRIFWTNGVDFSVVLRWATKRDIVIIETINQISGAKTE